ncbi:MAG: hypothetical protein LBF78_06875 [Treponema sp.]|jgi:hypothetical protein|nr:hypothetical protein [Treponema sp.]
MILAASIKNKVIITITKQGTFRLERIKKGDPEWLLWTAAGFVTENQETIPQAVGAGDFLDNHNLEDGLYAYRCTPLSNQNPQKEDYYYANWVRCGETGPIGYTFGNYSPAPGTWGEAICPDDLRFTYLWGNDFKATNGQSYSDEQIRFFINSSIADLERRLDITIKKKRIRTEPEKRNLVKGKDYDIEEEYYDFRYEKIARYGTIVTNQRPIIKLHRLDVINRFTTSLSLLDSTVVDKTKGVLKMLRRPIRPSETIQGISTAIYPYGKETFNQHMFYAIDYDAGYETSDDIPMDLREAIGKNSAISLLNVIGDGLMSGFSSSSLSMDGMSESFSSTQSATSAYFGARIKVYEDELKDYIEEVRRKFGFMQMGVL